MGSNGSTDDSREVGLQTEFDLLVSRGRIGVCLALASSCIFAVADALRAPGDPAFLYAIKLVQIVAALAGLILLWKPKSEERAAGALLLVGAIFFACTAYTGSVLGDALSTPLLCITGPMVAAALVPWAIRHQLALSAIALAALVANGRSLSVPIPVFLYALIGLGLTVAVSVHVLVNLRNHRLVARAADTARRESDERFQQLAENSADVIGLLDVDTASLLYANPALRELLGEPIDLDTLAGVDLSDRLHPDDHAVCAEFIQRTLSGEVADPAESVDLRVVRTDGTIRWIQYRLFPIFNEGGRIYRLGVLAHDFTASKKAEDERLQEAEISATLAHAGQELIGALSSPDLLQRLCSVTCEVLGCGASYTLQVVNDEISVIAVHADDEKFVRRGATLPASPQAMGAFMEVLCRESVVQFSPGSVGHAGYAEELGKFGFQWVVCSPLYRGEEIVGVQCAAFNDRAQPLESWQTRIFSGLAHLASLAQETTRLLEELEEADRFKSQFLANMSHELRTPLNVIIGYNEMILDHAFGAVSAEQKGVIGKIQRNAAELLDLVNASLELSRYDEQGIRLDVDAVSIADLVSELSDDLAWMAERGEVELVWQVDGRMPSLRTDRLKLKMILKNLIDNAMKYTDRGSVTVSGSVADDDVVLRVSDTGPGIDAVAIGQIFEPFRQVDEGRTQGKGGVGLGLYIVKRLLDALGGVIQVDSEPDKGTCFTVRLPLTHAATQGAQKKHDATDRVAAA